MGREGREGTGKGKGLEEKELGPQGTSGVAGPQRPRGKGLGLGRGGHFISRATGIQCPKVHAGATQRGEGGVSLESTLTWGETTLGIQKAMVLTPEDSRASSSDACPTRTST